MMRSHGRPKQRKEITLMKIKLVKSIMAPLVVACALVSMVTATATGQGTEGGRLQGTWEMQITLTDCAGHVIRSFPSLVEFVAGGTVVESNGGTPQALKTPGEGVWRTPLTIAMRFASNSSRLVLRTSLRAGRSFRGKQ